MGSIKWDDLNSEKKYNSLEAYQQSKVANILFTKELANILKGIFSYFIKLKKKVNVF